MSQQSDPHASPQQGGSPGRPGLFDVQGFVRRYIPFSSRFLSGQKSGSRGQWLTAAFTLSATDTAFTIALGHIPSGYVICRKSGQGQLFDGTQAGADWTATKIVLRSSTAVTYSLFVF